MFKKISLVALSAAGCIAFNSAAFASYDETSENEEFAESLTINEQSGAKNVVRSVNKAVSTSLSRAMSSAMMKFSDAGTGLAAGDSWTEGVSMWGTVDLTAADLNTNDGSGERETTMTTGVFGMDKMVNDNMIVGAAISFAGSTSDGTNGNGTSLSQKSRSFSVAPYIGYIFNENFAIDGTLGLTLADVETENSKTGALVSSDTAATTSFAAVNLNYIRPLNDMFAVKAFTGYSIMKTSMDGFTDDANVRHASTESHTWQARVGSTLMMNIDDRTEAYVSGAYERDKENTEYDEDAARFSLGATRVLNDNAILTLEGTSTAFRDSQSEYGGSINLRYSF